MKNFGANSIKSFLKNNYKYLILFFLLAVLNIFFLCWSFSTNGLPFDASFIILLIGSIILEIIFCILIFISKKKEWKIEKTFLILGLIVGFIYVLALPVGRAPDEESHFFRVYELSTGHLVSDVTDEGKIGSTESANIEIIRDFKENNVTYGEIIDNLDLYPNEEETFVRTSAYSYNIFSYLPHVIGMLIGRLFNSPLLISAYLVKLFNLISCILILYFSIKFIPFLEKIIFFAAFLPVTMQAMASLSPDGLTIALSIALISFVLYSIYTLKDIFSKKQLCLLFFLCLFLSMSKIAYAPLCLLLFSIPKERFGDIKRKILTIFAMGIIVFIILLTWIIVAPSLQSNGDSSAQISLILTNPFKYLAIIIRSISSNASLYISGFLGGYLEWFNIVLSPIYIYSFFIIFILLCNKENQLYTITKSFKIISIFVSIFITLLIFTTMFVEWTKVGETVIDGVQGRYFIPIILFIPTWFLPTKKFNNKLSLTHYSKTLSAKFQQNYYLYGFLVFESVYAITAIACSHL